jgi:hypothetical protein
MAHLLILFKKVPIGCLLVSTVELFQVVFTPFVFTLLMYKKIWHVSNRARIFRYLIKSHNNSRPETSVQNSLNPTFLSNAWGLTWHSKMADRKKQCLIFSAPRLLSPQRWRESAERYDCRRRVTWKAIAPFDLAPTLTSHSGYNERRNSAERVTVP